MVHGIFIEYLIIFPAISSSLSALQLKNEPISLAIPKVQLVILE